MSKSNGNPGANLGGNLVPQEHGGALLQGGNWGNVNGAGRPASEIRARMRGMLEDKLHIAQDIADDPDTSDSDRLRALDFLAKYGIGTKQELVGKDDEPLFDSDSANDFTKRIRQLVPRQ